VSVRGGGNILKDICKDICGATDRETEAVVRWMMDALVDAAMRDSE